MLLPGFSQSVSLSLLFIRSINTIVAFSFPLTYSPSLLQHILCMCMALVLAAPSLYHRLRLKRCGTARTQQPGSRLQLLCIRAYGYLVTILLPKSIYTLAPDASSLPQHTAAFLLCMRSSA